MVVTAQHLATEIGVDVLKRGGNAIDAAVAVGYALAVVYPAAGNLGGGGFMTIQLADGRKTFFDFREKAPLAATRRHVPRRRRQRRPGIGDDGPPRGGCSRHGLGSRGCAREIRQPASQRVDGAGDPLRRAGLRARPGRRRHVRQRGARVQGRSGHRRDLPAQRPGLRRGRSPGAGRSGANPQADQRCRRRRVLPGAGGTSDRGIEPGRWRPADRSRPRALPHARDGACRMRLPRLPRRVGAAAERGRRHRLRDPRHPGGLSAEGLGLPFGARRARADRGDASCLRRSQPLPRRS